MNKKLPKGWVWAKLGEVCEISGEYGSNCRAVPFNNVRYIRITDIDDRGHLVDAKKCSPDLVENKYFLKPGDLLLARSGSVGRSYIHGHQKGDFQFAGYLIRYRPAPKIVFSRYLFYITKSAHWFDWINKQAKAATIANINAKQFSSFDFPLPSLAEQKRIAARLDRQMAAADKIRTAAEAQLEDIRVLPAALLREAFSGTPPLSWKSDIIGGVAKIFAGGPAPQNRAMFALDGVPFFRVSDLSVERRTQCLRNAKDRISPKHAAELRLVKAKKGAVVFPKSGAAVLTNNRGILGADGFIVSHLMALDAGPKTTPQWLYWTLCQIDMEKFAGNISYPSVKKSVVEEIEIPLPPLAEQKRITARLNRQMAAADKIRAAAEARLEDIRALPAALLRRAFSFSD